MRIRLTAFCLFSLVQASAFVVKPQEASSRTVLASSNGPEEYRNAATELLSNFMMPQGLKSADPLGDVDFDVPKQYGLDLTTLATALDAELYEKEWFVTGNVNPAYFADEFRFQDPDVKLTGIEQYARGVNRLFDQNTARAEIISTVVSSEVPNTITCTWRLSGKVDIGPGLTIKPYIVYTDFTVDPTTGLIVFQEDRFDIPQWDILLSALVPSLIGKVTAPPAPPVEPRSNVPRLNQSPFRFMGNYFFTDS